LQSISPVAKIAKTVALLQEAAQSLVVPDTSALPIAVPPAQFGPWDEDDMAVAEEPFDPMADEVEDQWVAAFEAATSMGLETDV
jgi:hypothetical protein